MKLFQLVLFRPVIPKWLICTLRWFEYIEILLCKFGKSNGCSWDRFKFRFGLTQSTVAAIIIISRQLCTIQNPLKLGPTHISSQQAVCVTWFHVRVARVLLVRDGQGENWMIIARTKSQTAWFDNHKIATNVILW